MTHRFSLTRMMHMTEMGQNKGKALGPDSEDKRKTILEIPKASHDFNGFPDSVMFTLREITPKGYEIISCAGDCSKTKQVMTKENSPYILNRLERDGFVHFNDMPYDLLKVTPIDSIEPVLKMGLKSMLIVMDKPLSYGVGSTKMPMDIAQEAVTGMRYFVSELARYWRMAAK